MIVWARKHQQRTALIGAGLLVVAVSLLTSQRVPLYDGIGFPDEPYRYVVAPSVSKRTKLPVSSTQVAVAVQNGTNDNYAQITSNETGPQISIYLAGKVLQTDPGATTDTVTATPLAPDADKPAGGQVLGNIYRITASSDVGTVKFVGTSSNPSFVDLRLPQGYPAGAEVVYRPTPGSSWTNFITTQIGSDIYQAPLIGFGDYGLIASKTVTATNQSLGRKQLVLIVTAACFILAIVLAVVLIRVRSDR